MHQASPTSRHPCQLDHLEQSKRGNRPPFADFEIASALDPSQKTPRPKCRTPADPLERRSDCSRYRSPHTNGSTKRRSSRVRNQAFARHPPAGRHVQAGDPVFFGVLWRACETGHLQVRRVLKQQQPGPDSHLENASLLRWHQLDDCAVAGRRTPPWI